MKIEVLFHQACGLYGDGKNPVYLQKTLPDAEFIYTDITKTPYFAENDPDMIMIGSMSENMQRRVIEKLRPYKERISELIDKGTVILATGNAGEIFTKKITYLTEKTEIEGLGIFDLEVKNDLFKRYNGKVIGTVDGITVVGFRSQFSFIYGDNLSCGLIKVERGVGINKESKIEGMRKNNLICTSLLGPLLPLNPLFCEYIVSLAGEKCVAAYKDAAMDAYNQRVKEFKDPSVKF